MEPKYKRVLLKLSGEALAQGAAPGAIYNSFVYLREDFGCTWDGTITLKDCTYHLSEGDANVFFYKFTNWDYGYRCHFPDLVIDNPTICGLAPDAKIHLVWELIQW